MTDQPSTPGLRGAVDLTGLAAAADRPAPSGASAASAASAPSAPGAVPGRSGLVVEGTDATFSEVVNGSISVPSVVVLWASQIPESRDYLDTVIEVARTYDGRFQVVSIDVEQNPALLRAFQVQTVPVTLGLLQGQPVPLFAGIQPA